MDNQEEVVIFEDPNTSQRGGQAAQQSATPQDDSQKKETNHASEHGIGQSLLNNQIGQNNPQNQTGETAIQHQPGDNVNQKISETLAKDPQGLGKTIGAEQGEMEKQKTQIQSPEVLKQAGEQDAIKEAAKEAKKVEESSDESLKEQGQNEGIKEAAKESKKSMQTTAGKLDTLVQHAQQPLLQLKTSGYLLLNLIPDVLTIDPVKIVVRYRSLFGGEYEKSAFVKDITDVTVEAIPFAALLRITDSTNKEPIVVKPFKKEDAERAKSIILGLLAIHKEDIDPTTLNTSEDTAKKLEDLGKGAKTIE